MSNERVILCGDADWPARGQGFKEPIRLQLSGGEQNVDLRIQDISKRLVTNISKFSLTSWRLPPMCIAPTKPLPGEAKPIWGWGRSGGAT
jgi:hypothetical protein